MTWADLGDWRLWLEGSTWGTLLFCLTPVFVSLAVGLIIGGPEAVFTLRRRRMDQPLWVKARFSSDAPWVKEAELALYDRMLERSDQGYTPRPGLGALMADEALAEDAPTSGI